MNPPGYHVRIRINTPSPSSRHSLASRAVADHRRRWFLRCCGSPDGNLLQLELPSFLCGPRGFHQGLGRTVYGGIARRRCLRSISPGCRGWKVSLFSCISSGVPQLCISVCNVIVLNEPAAFEHDHARVQ